MYGVNKIYVLYTIGDSYMYEVDKYVQCLKSGTATCMKLTNICYMYGVEKCAQCTKSGAVTWMELTNICNVQKQGQCMGWGRETLVLS